MVLMYTNIAYMKTSPHMHLIHVQTKLSHVATLYHYLWNTCLHVGH